MKCLVGTAASSVKSSLTGQYSAHAPRNVLPVVIIGQFLQGAFSWAYSFFITAEEHQPVAWSSGRHKALPNTSASWSLTLNLIILLRKQWGLKYGLTAIDDPTNQLPFHDTIAKTFGLNLFFPREENKSFALFSTRSAWSWLPLWTPENFAMTLSWNLR